MNIVETLKGLQNLIITLENTLRDTKEALEEERTQHKDTAVHKSVRQALVHIISERNREVKSLQSANNQKREQIECLLIEKSKLEEAAEKRQAKVNVTYISLKPISK